MKTLFAFRHTAFFLALAAFLILAQPIIASTAFGLILGAAAPIMAVLEWMLLDETKANQ